MKKAVFSVALLIFLTACFPVNPAPAVPSQVVDAAGTAEAMLKTAIVQTLTAQPTGTSTPPISSQLSSETPTLPSEPLLPATETMTPMTVVDAATAAPTGTFDLVTSTGSPASFNPLPATGTLTPGVLTYGTLPPAVPYSNITLINRAKTQAYISLQVVTAEGGPTIMEYPVRGKIEIEAPVGNYLYVAWVGGRKMVGEFKLRHDNELEIVLYRDRVEVK